MRVWAIRLTACFTIIQGFVNGVSLVFVSIGIVRESATRFIEPKPMGSSGLMTTSVIGLAVNALGLLLCAEAHTHSHRDGTSCPALSGWGGGKCENAEGRRLRRIDGDRAVADAETRGDDGRGGGNDLAGGYRREVPDAFDRVDGVRRRGW